MRRLTGMITAAAVIAATAGMATSQAAARAADSPRCHTSELTIRDGGGNGAAGSFVVSIEVKNVSGHTCHTRGFAGLTLIGRLGNVLPTHVRTGGPSHRVNLRSGQMAHFTLSIRQYAMNPTGAPCHSPTARKLRVIPPDETDYRLVTLRGRGIRPCGGRIDEGAITR